MANEWDQYSVAPPGSSNEWEQFTPKAAASAPEVSKLESGWRGATQGATLGFGDEMSGGVGAGLELFNPTDPNEAKKSLWDRLSKVKENYQTYRDSQRQQNEAAQETNPVSYGTGELAGSIVPIALGGSGLAARTALSAPVRNIALNTGVGSLSGLGTSNSADISGDLANTAVGGGTGLILGSTFEGAGALKNKFVKDVGVKELESVQDAMKKELYPGTSWKNLSAAEKAEVADASYNEIMEGVKKHNIMRSLGSIVMEGAGGAGLGVVAGAVTGNDIGKTALIGAGGMSLHGASNKIIPAVAKHYGAQGASQIYYPAAQGVNNWMANTAIAQPSLQIGDRLRNLANNRD
jgi:hypothetical protein